jgi:hypothetical protein
LGHGPHAAAHVRSSSSQDTASRSTREVKMAEHHRQIRRSKGGALPWELMPCGTRERPGAVLVSRRGQCLRHRTRWPGGCVLCIQRAKSGR